MSRRPLELRIDVLTVHGFDPSEHEAIAEAVQTAFARSLVSGGLTAQGNVSPVAGPVGAAVGQSILGARG